MKPRPQTEPLPEAPGGRLQNKVALISGGDSGIGKAVALLFAQEGADIAIVYFNEHKDAKNTAAEIEAMGREVLLLAGDIADKEFCDWAVQETLRVLKGLDILINNAAVQYPHEKPEAITEEQLARTFGVNVFGAFYLTIAALPFLKKGSSVINTTSVTAYRGSHHLIDYAATKGALVAFTRSLSSAIIDRGIRVNAVAPGPVWTPLIPASFSKKEVSEFGQDTPMKRPGQPNEIAACYLFLATDSASYMTGQVLHPNGGEIVNG